MFEDAQKFTGIKFLSKLGYFAPDDDAPYGRYWDGHPISEHPPNQEINDYWEFWVALANKEQKEVVQGMFDMGIAQDFINFVQKKTDYEVVEEAIKWWIKHYAWEYKEFTEYIASQKAILRDPSGWDRSKKHKFQGAIPSRVKMLVMGARPLLCRTDHKSDSDFHKLFYQIYTKALIGG